MGVAITLADIAKRGLLGSGSSGGGSAGGGSSGDGWPEVPDDGANYLFITLPEGRTSPMLGVGVNGTVTVDWGDGTEPDVLTGTSYATTQWTPTHNYAASGNYVIRLMVDGEMVITGANTSGGSGSNLIRHNDTYGIINKLYNGVLRKVKLNNIKEVNTSGFYEARALNSIVIPEGAQRVNNYAFSGCSGLESVVIPDSVTQMNGYVFSGCVRLSSVVLSNNIPAIGNGAFNSCYSLTKVKIPASVASIGTQAFYECGGMVCYDFTSHTAVPTLSNTNAFNKIPDDCEIRVPAALYDEWIAATNWSTYADYIKAY